MLPIVFNGKFYSGPLNGVHRVADRLIRECDAILAATDPDRRPRARLIVPQRRRWQPELRAIELVEEARGGSQLWEQFLLPRSAAGGVAVSLANLAPIAHRRSLLLLHDAQFLFPDSSYPLRQRLGYRLLVPRMARASAQVLTVSDYSRQMLALLGVSARERTAVLYNGADHIVEQAADHGARERMGLVAGSYVLLFGSAKEYKNNRVLFDAFAGGALAPLRLVIVGPERETLRRAGLGPPADALFAGPIDDAGLRALYECACCLVFPSRTEGFGLPPVEAMLCGCPVVAAPAGAIPEICRDAVLYADVDDAAGWALAIRRIAEPALREGKIVLGRQRAAGFTWQRAGAALMRHIEALGRSAGKGAPRGEAAPHVAQQVGGDDRAQPQEAP